VAHGYRIWIDRSLGLVYDRFNQVWLCGDTDFSLTKHFDRWDERCKFVFGIDAQRNLVRIANGISESQWQPLERKPKYEVKTRQGPENIKKQNVKERGFENIRTVSEHVAEFHYSPVKSKET